MLAPILPTATRRAFADLTIPYSCPYSMQAWHASGTYSAKDGTGGSNGSTMRFASEAGWGANAGLKVARDLLAPIAAAHPGLSTADLWTLAGVVAVQQMGGPAIAWRPGRVDYADDSKARGGLPMPGSPAISFSFYRSCFHTLTGRSSRTAACPTPPRRRATSVTSSTAWASM